MKSNYKKKEKRLYSPTHVNNYNNFLKHLDDKQKSIDVEEKKVLDAPLTSANNKTSNESRTNAENNKEKETHLQEILRILNDSFKIYDINWSLEQDNKKIFDPNIFQIAEPKQNTKPFSQAQKQKPVPAPVYAGPKEKKEVVAEINNISDLLKLIEDYALDEKIEYNINMESMHNIKEPLIELNNMIGMHDLKENIVDQILYFSQNLHKVSNKCENSGDYMHTVIYGPPGSGKTEIARIMGKLYSKMGILKRGVFKKVTRSDLIAGYLGQTAIKTKDVINECLGGVLFIDEAYSLGNSEKRDSFSKECIDTLCEALSANKDNLMVIVAGYENELKDCFFNYNQGLDSRFVWRFKTEDYTAAQLRDIFFKKVENIGWSVDETASTLINVAWFEKNMVYFKYFGRDIEGFLSKVKIAHSRRVFCENNETKTKITFKDFEKGFTIYLKNDDIKKRNDDSHLKFALSSMYL